MTLLKALCGAYELESSELDLVKFIVENLRAILTLLLKDEPFVISFSKNEINEEDVQKNKLFSYHKLILKGSNQKGHGPKVKRTVHVFIIRAYKLQSLETISITLFPFGGNDCLCQIVSLVWFEIGFCLRDMVREQSIFDGKLIDPNYLKEAGVDDDEVNKIAHVLPQMIDLHGVSEKKKRKLFTDSFCMGSLIQFVVNGYAQQEQKLDIPLAVVQRVTNGKHP